mmetsp:Transcript_29623/g.65673  ORF Transcript_29623/g.65673 Transcript_29623/m.65673 type:complete len:297 (-) Transcript_29623:17-907(-)
MSDVYGDAFKDDRSEAALYGQDIYESASSFNFNLSVDMPSSKSNNVSFMKAEPLPLGLRNVLAVSDTHICYSVTSKKNLLRVIDTLSGEKVILRGHESAVLDLQFSPADGSVLCSVDDAGGAGFDGKPHCIVWRKQGGCDWQTHASLLLPATQVVPHPQSPLVWALCDGVRVGVVDCAQGSQLTAGSYEALPLNVRLEGSQGKITDVAFSPSGTRLLVVVQPLPGGGPSLLRTYALGSSSGGGSGGSVRAVSYRLLGGEDIFSPSDGGDRTYKTPSDHRGIVTVLRYGGGAGAGAG